MGQEDIRDEKPQKRVHCLGFISEEVGIQRNVGLDVGIFFEMEL